MNSIEVENMTKVFKVLHRQGTMKSEMLNLLRFRLPRREEFVALRDISFSVPQGQTVGVIGRNGSGKSTLLALLARIYRPTVGRIRVRGRIATLLELGAGFNTEFTGIENVFLNGVILGVPRDELERSLPGIIEFAELEEFIDTPVKHYSSGMITRLGFAVAVHVRPDVLLVDEVLAVGDYRFQEKCYAKIEEFKKQGVTIFFVSHDMRAIQRVSDRVLWIDQHVVRADGPAQEVIAQYNDSQAV
ncbi:MAG TPA: ABC transporter ATP-binding protein [Abditibacteriaceae bacterium]|jgi:ABC-type polysaccharide/polyol phosphate transport system ATPase subunit